MTVYSEKAVASFAAKAVHPDPESREGKLLETIRKEVGAPRLPTYEEVFASHFIYNLPATPIEKLAVFNDNNGWKDSTTAIGKLMRDISGHFGGDNILNPHAEVDPRRVIVVLSKIISMGKLYNPIKAFKVDNLDQRSKKKAALAEYQIFDGRNRAAALAILFGPNLKIPLWIDEEGKSKATIATLEANNVRATRNLEKVAVQGVEMQSSHPDPATAFKSFHSNSKKIARWVVAQTHILKNKQFDRVSFQITERVQRGTYAIPVTGYQEFVKHSIRLIDRKHWDNLDAFTPSMNKVLAGLDALSIEIPKVDESGDLKNYWTAYTCPAFGTLLADSIFVGKKEPEAAGKALAKKAAAYLKEKGVEDFNRMPPARLADVLRDYKG